MERIKSTIVKNLQVNVAKIKLKVSLYGRMKKTTSFTLGLEEEFNKVYSKEDPYKTKSFLPEKYRINVLLKFLKGQKFDKILDVGCGEGFFTRKISRHGNTVIGIDISFKALSRAKRNCSKGRFIVCDIRKIPLNENEEFDLICVNSVLYYFSHEEQMQILNELYELLKKKGVIIISSPIHPPFWSGKTAKKYPQPSELVNLISSKFKIKKIIPIVARYQFVDKRYSWVMFATKFIPKILALQIAVLARKC